MYFPIVLVMIVFTSAHPDGSNYAYAGFKSMLECSVEAQTHNAALAHSSSAGTGSFQCMPAAAAAAIETKPGAEPGR